MAISTVLSCICILIASIFSFVASQGAPGDTSLFNTLMNSQPGSGAPSVLDPSLNSLPTGGSAALGNLLSMNPMAGAANSFAPVTGVNTAPPNPTYPTLGGTGGFGSPLNALPAPKPQPNPMSFLPYMLFSGMDFGNLLMMMLMGQGGAGGGLFSNPFAMMLMGNQLF